MHNDPPGIPFARLVPGTVLPPLGVTVSAAANERYWQAAGADHPLLSAGALYPPIAANLTVLCFNGVCHARGEAGIELVTAGAVTDRYEKRGRDYVDVRAEIRAGDQLLWTSEVSFTPAATLKAQV
jgi:hypothetical protein